MRIYSVVTYDNAHAWYYYGSRKEAEAAARQFRQRYKEDGEYDNATVEIEVIRVAPTRAGVAQAIQDVIDMTCVNEH